MAREAGIDAEKDTLCRYEGWLEPLKAFEALVRDDEREQGQKWFDAVTAQHKRDAAPVQEPVVWKWHQAPVKTSWGHDMVVADLAIDRDNTVSVYCERDQTAKVEVMFTPPAASMQPVQEPVNLLEARKIAAEYGAPDSQVDNGNLYFALSKCLEHIDAQPAPVQEPIGYLFQHEETGLTTVVDVQQVEWGFEKNNPRHQKIGPVYTTPPAAQRQCEDDK
jgi:hypothetical protein